MRYCVWFSTMINLNKEALSLNYICTKFLICFLVLVRRRLWKISKILSFYPLHRYCAENGKPCLFYSFQKHWIMTWFLIVCRVISRSLQCVCSDNNKKSLVSIFYFHMIWHQFHVNCNSFYICGFILLSLIWFIQLEVINFYNA